MRLNFRFIWEPALAKKGRTSCSFEYRFDWQQPTSCVCWAQSCSRNSKQKACVEKEELSCQVPNVSDHALALNDSHIDLLLGTIADVGALNTHLSTRSYIEGGHKPTAADEAQFSVLPKACTYQQPNILHKALQKKYFLDDILLHFPTLLATGQRHTTAGWQDG